MPDDAIISVYVQNLGRYNEGKHFGEWVNLPTTMEHIEGVFRRAGIDGIRYEEWFFSDRSSSINSLLYHIGEFENLDELNYLAARLQDLSEYELKVLDGAIEIDSPQDVTDIINLTANLDCFTLYEGIETEEELGDYMLDELQECFSPMVEELRKSYDHSNRALARYIDTLETNRYGESYGTSYSINATGVFTKYGFIEETDSSRREIYSDRDDIPDEYRVIPIFPLGSVSLEVPDMLVGEEQASRPQDRGGDR